MSDNKDKPLNADELSEIEDIVTNDDAESVPEEETIKSHADSVAAANELSDEKIIADMGVDNVESKNDSENSTIKNQNTSAKKFGVLGVFGFIFGSLWRITRIGILVCIILGSLFFAAYVLQQDDLVRSQFEGKRWALPARVFARPLELYEGQSLRPENLQKELQLLGYSYVTHLVLSLIHI